MPSKDDLKNAKKAYDMAWAQATKYGDEALAALKILEEIPARDTDDIFTEKAKRALVAYNNWRAAAHLAQKVLNEYYSRLGLF